MQSGANVRIELNMVNEPHTYTLALAEECFTMIISGISSSHLHLVAMIG